MRSKQDGTEIPPYAEEVADSIAKLGKGGDGNFESLQDAAEKGVTPALVAKRAPKQQGDAGKVDASTKGEPPKDYKRINEIAYSIWLVEGQPHGHDLDHWLRAERIASGK